MIKIIICIFIVIFLISYINKTICVDTLMNKESQDKCILLYDDGISSRRIEIEGEEKVYEIFNFLHSKKAKKIMPWDGRKFITSYNIITQDNHIIIYNHRYISVLINSKRKTYKLIDTIDLSILDKYLNEYQ
jgi:hypothetical protein